MEVSGAPSSTSEAAPEFNTELFEEVPHWPKVLDLMIDELIQAAGEPEARIFLQQVGSRLADSLPLGQPGTLSELESEINRRLSQLTWGWCSIRDAGRHLVIEHGDYPLMATSDVGEGSRSRLIGLSWVLSGTYKGWLDSQGGHAMLDCQRCQPHRPLVFHYGSG